MRLCRRGVWRQPRQTQRERLLRRMDALIPWARLEARIRPVYPAGERGRPSYLLALLLRIQCVQLFYSLSDPAMEDASYDSVAVPRFVGLMARGQNGPPPWFSLASWSAATVVTVSAETTDSTFAGARYTVPSPSLPR